MNRPQVYICPLPLESPSHLPPHHTPLGCHRAPTLGSLKYTANVHWPSVLHIVIYMFPCYCLHLSHPLLPLGNGTPLQCSCWKIPWMEEPGWLQSMGSLRVRHDWMISLSLFTFMHWRRKWQPTPVFLPGESQGRRSLVGYGRLWGGTELDTTEAT